VFHVDCIKDDIKGQIWKILENNMHAMYAQVIDLYMLCYKLPHLASLQQSSFGWNTREKKSDTFQEDARFLICLHKLSENQKVVGFAMFRFEGDEGGPSGEIESVLYWYAMCLSGTTVLPTRTASIH